MEQNEFLVALQHAIRIMDDSGPTTKVQMICGLGDKDIMIELRQATKEEVEDSPSGFSTTGFDPFTDKRNEELN